MIRSLPCPDDFCSDPLVSALRRKAEELGFVAIGFSRPGRLSHFDRFTEWLSKGHHAGMAWMERNTDLREDPSGLLSRCRSIITLAYPYRSGRPATPDGFFVSRHSEPALEDYHRRLKRLCFGLVRMIQSFHSTAVNRVFVDSAPVLERSIAFASGIGFIGKNTMLIIPGLGSYFCLSEIFTTAPIDAPSVTPMASECASCSLCLEACPGGAIEEGSLLNASKCLSYWTIESRDTVGPLGRQIGPCFFGCDRCQEACPHNKSKATSEVLLPSTEEFLAMRDEEFLERFGWTSLSRAGLEKIKSNIQAARKGP